MARLTSTRWGISYVNPATRDEPADVPADIAILVTALETAGVRFTQGTTASRPAAGKLGSFHWSTDQTILSYDNGSAWTNIGPPFAGSIGTTQLADNAVTQVKMADDSVGTAELIADSVGTSEIAPNAVTNTELADDAVNTAEIADNAVTQAQMADNAVGAPELIADSVGTSELAPGAVTTVELDAAVLQRLAQPGFTMIWPYAEASIPTGFVALYGQAVSRSANPVNNANASAAGYPHGSGDGSTTFNLVDTRGRTFFGKDDTGGTPANRISVGNNGRTIGGVFGAETVTLTLAQSPAHSHTVNAHNHGGGTAFGGVHSHGYGGANAVFFDTGDLRVLTPASESPPDVGIWAGFVTENSTSHDHGIAVDSPGTNSQGGGGSHPNLPPGVIGIWIIRLG